MAKMQKFLVDDALTASISMCKSLEEILGET